MKDTRKKFAFSTDTSKIPTVKPICFYITYFVCLIALAHSQSESRLEGEAFIVTKGAENIRLGALEIRIYPMEAMIDHIKKRNERVRIEMPDFDADIASRTKRIEETKKNIASLKSLGGVELAPFKDGLQIMERNQDRDITAKRDWPTSQHYFKDLPDTKLTTRTDGAGKFSYELARDRVYILVAHIARETYTSKDRFYWLVRVSTDMRIKRVLLSNFNLVTSDSQESLIRTKSAWTRWEEP